MTAIEFKIARFAEGDTRMEQERTDARMLAEDDMASYGLHPAIHEELVRCHNPAREPALAPVQRRVRRRLREAVDAQQAAAGLTLSA